MDCQTAAALRARKLSKVVTLIFVFLTMFVALLHAVTGSAQVPAMSASDVLRQAKTYQVRFRSGDLAVLPEYVATLEDATKAYPDDADVWYAMGVAYLAQAARGLMPDGNPADAMGPMQKGPAALRRALQINPNHAEALSQIGGVQALLGPVFKLPAMTARGVAQMNRAVELAPDSTRPRLQRAFVGLNLPDELRNHEAEGQDLDFLIGVGEWSRAGDYVRLMRADLYFETGSPDLAREMYRAVESSGSAAALDATARLSSLEQGGVPMTEVKALRAAAGAKCTLCHGGS